MGPPGGCVLHQPGRIVEAEPSKELELERRGSVDAAGGLDG